MKPISGAIVKLETTRAARESESRAAAMSLGVMVP